MHLKIYRSPLLYRLRGISRKETLKIVKHNYHYIEQFRVKLQWYIPSIRSPAFIENLKTKATRRSHRALSIITPNDSCIYRSTPRLLTARAKR